MPKGKLVDAMYALSRVTVKPPVKMAQVIVSEQEWTWSRWTSYYEAR